MHAIVRTSARRLVLSVAAATVSTTVALPLPAHAAPAPLQTATPTIVDTFADELDQAVLVADRRARLEAQRKARIEAARRAVEAARARAHTIIGLAEHEAGDPYVWGADGPSAFDCSGYTRYVFGQLGISLPHNAAAQAAMARRVSDPQVGDLVFFGSGHVYHVAIYAGDGYIWHAPHPGSSVRKERIWTGDVFYGRVG